MIEHRDPDCTGVWDKTQREGVTSIVLSRRNTKIFCSRCHKAYAYTSDRWMEALRENVIGYLGINEAYQGRMILEREREGRR